MNKWKENNWTWAIIIEQNNGPRSWQIFTWCNILWKPKNFDSMRFPILRFWNLKPRFGPIHFLRKRPKHKYNVGLVVVAVVVVTALLLGNNVWANGISFVLCNAVWLQKTGQESNVTNLPLNFKCILSYPGDNVKNKFY